MVPRRHWITLRTHADALPGCSLLSNETCCANPTLYGPSISSTMVTINKTTEYTGMVPAHTKHPSLGRIMSQGKHVQDIDGQKQETLYINPNEEDVGRIEKLDWVQQLLAEPGMHIVLACAAMAPEPGVDPDHLFLGMLRSGIISDVMFLCNPSEGLFHSLVAMGRDVCGHRCTVHGGFTSAVIDETTGGLVYSLKKNGKLGPGPAFTVHLEVDYKKPIPSGSEIICTARVESVEGRKAWISAEVMDRPGGLVYASGRALYVTPRQHVDGDGGGESRQPQ